MNSYFIESFKVNKLWGYRSINLTFHKDVNILIGPNASGKTTILGIIHSILALDLPNLLNFNFNRAEIKLKGFKGRSVHTITVKRDAADGFLELRLGQKRLPIRIDGISDRRFSERYSLSERGSYSKSTFIRSAIELDIDIIRAEEFYDEFTALVPIVWLPVSRRLPVTDYEEERYTRTRTLESVDLRLEELLEGLFHYHSRLNTLLSKRYKEFEHQVLSVILYSKEHDQLDAIFGSMPSKLPTITKKEQLLGAFK
ncbi:AAA family ATPase, partial [Candidatus Poribacteria bacterium]|nr:AAA family ATPase [Candidatus Poribacteria bacterium]